MAATVAKPEEMAAAAGRGDLEAAIEAEDIEMAALAVAETEEMAATVAGAKKMAAISTPL